MSARTTRPRSRRGKNPLPVELDPVVESSEETEVAGGSSGLGTGLAQEVKPEPLGAPADLATGRSPRSSVHAEADEDRDQVRQESEEPACQGPQVGELDPLGPTDVFEKLQHVLCSLEAAATAWRVQPRQTEGSGMGTGGPDTEARLGGWPQEAEGLAERNAWLRLALDSRGAELSRLQVEKAAMEREVRELQSFLLRLEPPQPPPRSQAPRSCSEPSSPAAEPWAAQDPPIPFAQALLRRLCSDPSAQQLSVLGSAPESRIMEAQLEQLRGNIEKLKCFNRLLSAELQGCKGRCEALSMQLGLREAEATALHLALQDSEDCESAYGSLLALCAGSPCTRELAMAEQVAQRLLAQEGGTCPDQLPSDPEGSSVDRPSALEVAAQLRSCVQRLREHRALLKIPPEPGPTLAPTSTVPRAEAMVQSILDIQPGPMLPRLDKRQIQQDLVATRESLADLMLQLQLVRREKRGVELREAALRAQGPAHALLQAQLQWELALLRGGSAGSSGDSSGPGSSSEDEDEAALHPPAVPGGSQSLDSSPGSQEQDSEKLAVELAASLTRALGLQERLRALRDQLEQVVQKGRTRRMQSAELNRDLCRAHSSLVLAFRGAHRKQEEQRRMLEQQMSLMEARHAEELSGLEAEIRALRRPRPPPLPPRPLPVPPRPPRPPRPGETFL